MKELQPGGLRVFQMESVPEVVQKLQMGGEGHRMPRREAEAYLRHAEQLVIISLVCQVPRRTRGRLRRTGTGGGGYGSGCKGTVLLCRISQTVSSSPEVLPRSSYLRRKQGCGIVDELRCADGCFNASLVHGADRGVAHHMHLWHQRGAETTDT